MTAEGRQILRAGRELAKDAREELLAPLSEDERALLHELLLWIASSAEQAQAGALEISERSPAKA